MPSLKRKRVISKCRYVISVDIGVVNFAYAILDTKLNETIAVENKQVCAWKGSKDYVKMTETVVGFFRDSLGAVPLDDVELVIERQMKSGIMRIFAVSLEVAWFHHSGRRAIVISPQSVKRHFGTSTGKYASNKKAALDLMPSICVKHPLMRSKWVSLCANNDKIDDLADAIIQAFYFSETR